MRDGLPGVALRLRDRHPPEEPSDRRVPERVEARCDVKAMLARAPLRVAVALLGIHVLGEGLT